MVYSGIAGAAKIAAYNSGDSQLSLEERYQLVRGVGVECIQEDELKNLLDKKPTPTAYDGFEPSGRMHIA